MDFDSFDIAAQHSRWTETYSTEHAISVCSKKYQFNVGEIQLSAVRETRETSQTNFLWDVVRSRKIFSIMRMYVIRNAISLSDSFCL